MESKRMPEIRFAEFTGDWEQRKLDSIYKKVRNAFVGTATPYYVDSGYFYLQSNNVKDGQINRVTEVFINKEFYEKQKDKLLHTGDLVMVQSGHVGHTAVIPKELDGTAAHALIMFQEYKEQVNPYFLNFQFQTIESLRKLESIATGNTIKHILASEMKKFEVSLPQLEEQTQIGNFFKQLDNLITLHQQELETLKQTKQGFLQKMFPKEGESVPEIRFPGFTGEWEEQKLEELIEKGGSGGTPKSTNKSYYDGDIPFLAISDISNSSGYIDNTEKFISESGLENSAAWLVPKGAISLAMYASVGKLAILNIEVATSQAFYNMVFEDDSLRDFVYHRLYKANVSGEWTSLISTGTQANLNAKKIRSFMIRLPNDKEEISEIGSFFKKIDKTILFHQQELETLKQTKKAFLQKMFV